MKFGLIAFTLLVSQLSFAQTMEERKLKKDMLERADSIVERIGDIRKQLREEEVVEACEGIEDLFPIFKEHVNDIGGHMDLSSSRTMRTTNQALRDLILIDKERHICRQGKESEKVDPEKFRDDLQDVAKRVKKARRHIRRSDTDQSNNFNYEYDF